MGGVGKGSDPNDPNPRGRRRPGRPIPCGMTPALLAAALLSPAGPNLPPRPDPGDQSADALAKYEARLARAYGGDRSVPLLAKAEHYQWAVERYFLETFPDGDRRPPGAGAARGLPAEERRRRRAVRPGGGHDDLERGPAGRDELPVGRHRRPGGPRLRPHAAARAGVRRRGHRRARPAVPVRDAVRRAGRQADRTLPPRRDAAGAVPVRRREGHGQPDRAGAGGVPTAVRRRPAGVRAAAGREPVAGPRRPPRPARLPADGGRRRPHAVRQTSPPDRPAVDPVQRAGGLPDRRLRGRVRPGRRRPGRRRPASAGRSTTCGRSTTSTTRGRAGR